MTRPTNSELKALLLRSTPPPWEWYNGCSWWRLGCADDQSRHDSVLRPYVCADGQPTIDCNSRDRDLIVAAVNGLEELIAENEAMLDCLRQAVVRQAMQHTGPMIGGKCTEGCVLCVARALVEKSNGKT